MTNRTLMGNGRSLIWWRQLPPHYLMRGGISMSDFDHGGDASDDDLCPVCGILRNEELTPEAYEVLWDAAPALRAAHDAGESTYCPECGRQLTFGEGEGR